MLHAEFALCLLQIGLYSISFGFAWGPIGWLIPSEIHDLNTRAAGQSITVFTQLVSGATVTQSKCCHSRLSIVIFPDQTLLDICRAIWMFPDQTLLDICKALLSHCD